MDKLDIIKLKTVADIEAIDWKRYMSDTDASWIRHIKYPVAQKELNRICRLAMKSLTVILDNDMGDLYYWFVDGVKYPEE